MPERVSSWAAGARTRIRALGALFDAHPHAMVFGVALVLRLAAVLWLNHAPYDQGGDAPHYLSIARDLVEGRPYGFSSGDTTRVPLYQAFLALHLWLFGDALIVIAMTQALLGAATAVILTGTAQELAPGPRAWIAGLLWAVYPPSILNTVVLFTQPLQVFWLSAAFWMLFAGLKRLSGWRCAAASALWGLACLTRAGNLFFLPVFALAPVFCWRLAGGAPKRWRLAVSIAMLAAGGLSVVWWTGREFPRTYRLEYLVTNPLERQTLALVLRPIEPLHARASEWLRRASATAAGDAVTPPTAVPPFWSSIAADREMAIARRWQMEIGRAGTKLWQTFHAPDGLVQMQCRRPEAGYWAMFTSEFPRSPTSTLLTAASSSCLVVKSVAYVWHYVILAFSVPGLFVLGRRWPGVALLFVLYAGYTVAIVVLGSNYSNEIAAVPRFAFSLMPVPVLLGGLLAAGLVARESGTSGSGPSRNGTDAVRVAFLSTSRYGLPLNASADQKFRGLATISEVFVIGFSQHHRPRYFVQHARFYLLPTLPVPVLRYAVMFAAGQMVTLWLVWRHQVRILVAQSPYEACLGALVKRAGRWIGRDVALVVESHGDFEESVFMQRRVLFDGLYRSVMRRVATHGLNRADVLRAVSDSTRTQLERWVHGRPLIQFPTWTNIDSFVEAGLRRQAAPEAVLLYAGVLVPRKGVHHLIGAFGRIAAGHPDVRLVLASHDANRRYLDALRAQVRNLDLSDRVELVGPLSQDELAERMRTSRLFILPTYSEGLPRVVFEAMAAGLPVVATRVSGIPEIVEDGVTGLLVEPGEEETLAERLLWMLEHPNEAAEMGRRGRERAGEVFSTAAYIDGYRRVFDLAQSLLVKQVDHASTRV